VTMDLLGDINLDGIVVELEHRGCAWCGSSTLVIVGPGAGPHAAALACPHCHRNGGWLPKEAASFVTAIVKEFGRPTEPVIVRSPPVERTARNARRISNARKTRYQT
jgi:hypothetical protein